jgi:hypothetical protein
MLNAISSTRGRKHFENVIDGIYGTFETPAGKVCYLQTKAKLGSDGSNYNKLIKQLAPAREILNVKEMDFNQLLQRDLDDHRIATKLIEYFLNPPANSLPGFYPPILALLLPFNNRQEPIDAFPGPATTHEKDDAFGLSYECITHGDSYRVQYAVDENTKERLPIQLGVLRWDSSAAKLVIMDGQHRAMSLLAVDRTESNSWGNAGKGTRYQPFYEHHVKAWLDKARAAGKIIDLSKIELPVTICWFPQVTGSSQGPRPHLAARKLFVDVNNTARPPSESRLILLSDTQLDNIMARELLNRLRSDKSFEKSFPLFGVEYDNPDKTSTSPRRWSVVTSLEIIKDAVIRTVFGPPKLLKGATGTLQGKPAVSEMNARLREQLVVGDLFPQEIRDGDRIIKRDSIGNFIFPINDRALHSSLLDKFYETWGEGILRLLSEVLPYKSHLQALSERYDKWLPADNISSLARDAIFEGVGMLWTIEEAHELWLAECRDAYDERRAKPSQPDISKAWKIIDEDQRNLFCNRRAEIYLENIAARSESDELYKSLITYAAQIGLMLAWATLVQRSRADLTRSPAKIAQNIADAINTTLQSRPTASRDCRRILMKESVVVGFKPLNLLPKLEPGFAIQYRYLWLEIIVREKNKDGLAAGGLDYDRAAALLLECRSSYLKFAVELREKDFLAMPDIKEIADLEAAKAEANKRARASVIKEQSEAHKYWFGFDIEDARTLVEDALDFEHSGTTAADQMEPANENAPVDDTVPATEEGKSVKL